MKAKFLKAIKVLLVLMTMGCAATVVWSVYRYSHSDPRFSVKQVSVTGLKRVSEDDLMARVKLRTDRNTNIFAVDLEDIRTRVEQIQWIRYATVSRVLPDQVLIRVVEREPVGYARLRGHIYEFDAESTILEPDAASDLKLPILDGLSESDTEQNLSKIAMYNRILTEVGPGALSEVIVNKNNEVSVVTNQDPMIVDLGVDEFKERWSHYLALKEKITSEYKDAVRVDFRFRNKIIVSMHNDDDDDGKVIWDGKKKSL
jgi:cell division septal protein FtsQ